VFGGAISVPVGESIQATVPGVHSVTEKDFNNDNQSPQRTRPITNVKFRSTSSNITNRL
jgi:hypothetical protein